ncbi:hypothetical protein CP532_1840 [Ophiocordyceps camponoti-leonardi (nom. inval.)]|nr:hypothetical protein CP532_1840 [Ophiocordyceps camponoti-leonardi (nom. inval.)]
MSEYWKSTPRYWCKHCSCYVRDTNLERKNHESTARHQGAIQRSLRNMYREHEREEREKDRAKQEVARLNGLVSRGGGGGGGGGDAASLATAASQTQPREATEAERQKQREQLAEMGVAMPETLRGGMAIAGEWTVTSTRVIDDDQAAKVEAKAIGVRKREPAPERQGDDGDKDDDDRDDEEEAVRRLFKKPRRWGKDSKLAHGEEEARELDALLSGTVIELKPKRRGSSPIASANKIDHHRDDRAEETKDGIKKEEKTEAEEEEEARVEFVVSDEVGPSVKVKEEEPDLAIDKLAAADKPVVFKKRKPKGLRTK